MESEYTELQSEENRLYDELDILLLKLEKEQAEKVKSLVAEIVDINIELEKFCSE